MNYRMEQEIMRWQLRETEMKPYLYLLCLPLLLMLISCAPFRPGDPKSGMCNEMNSELIFSGSTSNARDAEIQAAEQPLLQQSYDKRCAK